MSLTNQQGVIRFGWNGSEGHIHPKKILGTAHRGVSIAGNSILATPYQVVHQSNIGTSNQFSNSEGWDPFDFGLYPFVDSCWSIFSAYTPAAVEGTYQQGRNLAHMNKVGNVKKARGPAPIIGIAAAENGYSGSRSENTAGGNDINPRILKKHLPQYGTGFYNIQHKDDIGTIKIQASKCAKDEFLVVNIAGGGGGAGSKYKLATALSSPTMSGPGGGGAYMQIQFPLSMFYERGQPVDFYLHYYIGAGGAGATHVYNGAAGGGATFIWWNHKPYANLEDVEYTPNDVIATVDSDGSGNPVWTVSYKDLPASRVRKSSLLAIASGGGGGGSLGLTYSQAGYGGSGMTDEMPQSGVLVGGDFMGRSGGVSSGAGTPTHERAPGGVGLGVGDSIGAGSIWDASSNTSSGGIAKGAGGLNLKSNGKISAPGYNWDYDLYWSKRNDWVNTRRSNLQSGPSPHMWSSRQCVLDDEFVTFRSEPMIIVSAGGGGGYYQGSSGSSVIADTGNVNADFSANGGGGGASYIFHPRLGDIYQGSSVYRTEWRFYKPMYFDIKSKLTNQAAYGLSYYVRGPDGYEFIPGFPGGGTVFHASRCGTVASGSSGYEQPKSNFFEKFLQRKTLKLPKGGRKHYFGGYGFTDVDSSDYGWGQGGWQDSGRDGVTISGVEAKDMAGRNGCPGFLQVYLSKATNPIL